MSEELARKFHETYERLAPSFGYTTRLGTRQFDPESVNGRLMIAVCGELLRHHAAALERLAERDAENAVLRDAINDALPWMIKLGDYIGNGTQADPMGRCNAILKMRIAVEKRDD